MPLEPDVQKRLQDLRNEPVHNLSDMDAKEIRRIMNEGITTKFREKVKDVKDFEFSHHENNITARLYIPENASDSLILYFHGGGYVYGNIETHDEVCRMAANYSGSRVLSVNYRLAPEHKFPAQLEDAIASLLWVQNNSELLGINPQKIAVAGDSSGGNLAAGLCLKVRDQNMKLPVLQVLLYPFVMVLDPSESMREYSEGYARSQYPNMGRFLVESELNDLSEILNPYFSVFMHDNLSGLPETVIVTAEFDSLRDQAETYLAKLRKAGVKATGIRGIGMAHGFANYAHEVRAGHNIMVMIWSLVGEILNERNTQTVS